MALLTKAENEQLCVITPNEHPVGQGAGGARAFRPCPFPTQALELVFIVKLMAFSWTQGLNIA